MGKNQAHKARQATRHSGASGDGESAGGGVGGDGMMDATFHTAAWHEARIASLMSSRMTWDDFKEKQKQDKLKEEKLAGVDAMREHRRQLDADRALRLGALAGKVDKKAKKSKKDKKDKKEKSKKSKEKSSSKKHKHEKRKRRRSSSRSASSSSSSGSDSEGGGGGGGAKKADGPIRLSEFLKG